MFGLMVVWTGSRHDDNRGLLCVEPHPTKAAPPVIRPRPAEEAALPQKVLLAHLASAPSRGWFIGEIAAGLQVSTAVAWGQLAHALDSGKAVRVPVPQWERMAMRAKGHVGVVPLFRYRRA